METEHLTVAEPADHPAAMRTSEGVGRVKQQLQIATPGDFHQRLDRACPSPEMDAKDARRSGRDEGLDPGGIQSVCARIDVTKYRRNLLPLQGVGAGDEGK